MIKSQLIQLVSEKQKSENRKVSYRMIEEATGIPASTISRFAQNKITRFEADTLSALCKYFGCEVGELIKYVDD